MTKKFYEYILKRSGQEKSIVLSVKNIRHLKKFKGPKL